MLTEYSVKLGVTPESGFDRRGEQVVPGTILCDDSLQTDAIVVRHEGRPDLSLEESRQMIVTH
jgi:hypothetical protein